jgi:hypothetical protein
VNSTPDEFVNCASVLVTDTQLDVERLQKDSTARPIDEINPQANSNGPPTPDKS